MRSRAYGENLRLALFWPVFGGLFYALEWLVPARSYHIMYHPLDSLIPFCEWFMIPYLFWFVFMVGGYVYTFFAEPQAFRRMMVFTIAKICGPWYFPGRIF